MRIPFTLLALLTTHLITAQSLLGSMPEPSSSVYAFEKVGDIMYVGGFFGQVDGQPRANVARFNTATGELDSWAPTGLTNGVTSINHVADKIVVGGAFTTVNGQNRQGICMFDQATGNLHPWTGSAFFLSWKQGVGVDGNHF